MSRLEELCFRARRMDLEEDFFPYGDGGEVRAALLRKEEELVLAAQLGNALLSENRQLKDEKNRLQEQYTEKIEELEQDRYDLRLKLQGCQVQWESQVGELERDVRTLSAHAETLTQRLCEAEREKSQSETQHSEIGQQLHEQLQALHSRPLARNQSSRKLERLQESHHPFRSLRVEEKAHSPSECNMDEAQILSRGKFESGGYHLTGSSSCEESMPLPDVVNSGSFISTAPEKAMEAKLAVTSELQSLKQELGERGHPRPQDEELLSALKEQVARLTQREQSLEQRLETVCEENTKLRESVSSLYTRLTLQEQQSKTQTQQLADAWQEVELTKDRAQDLQCQIEELQEEVILQRTTDGDTSLLSEMERSLDTMNWSQDKKRVIQEVSSILDMLLPVSRDSEVPCNQDDILQGMLGQLKSSAERIARNGTVQKLKKPIVGGDLPPCENPPWIQELRDQNAQLLKENAELRLKADSRKDDEIVQRAIKDRDDAISKKTAVEAELVRSRNDMMYLNNQLLEAIQRKLELSQELEAWQDDIQVIINQQLKSQTEQQTQSKRSGGGRLSFFRKPLKTSTSVSCIPEATTVPKPVPWKNWLKVAK